MLRIPAQFCCLLPLNLATMKSVPLPTWRTAALIFAPAPVARIACALPLLIMQQPVPGRASWCSGDNPTSAVSAVLLKPTYFPSPEGIFLATLDERSKMRCRFSLWQMMRVNLSSALVRMQKLFPGTAQHWGRETVVWHTSAELFAWISIFSYSPGNFLNVPG